MSRRLLAAGAALAALLNVPVEAAERALKGAEIAALLKGNTVVGASDGKSWKQFFDASGATTYVAGARAPSRGAWSVQGDKFCSQWPPNEKWTCYSVTGDVDANPKTVTWIGDGATYPGSVQAGDGL